MAARYFNWKLAIVLVVAVGVFTVAAYALHQWQKTTRAVQSLPLGDAAFARQDYEEAANQYGRYIVVNADDTSVLLKYAEAQLKRRPMTSNNVQQAIASYRNVLRLDPGNQEATRRLAEVYLSVGAPGEAELIAKRYLESRDDVDVQRLLADSLLQQRKPKEAVTVLTALLAKHPDDVASYERMGVLAEQYPEAAPKPMAAWYEEAVTRNPQSALAYIARAGFALRHGERDKALADLEQARKCDLSQKDVRLRLVAALKGANLLDQAREQLQALQATEPGELTLWQHWADLASRANSSEEMYAVARNGLQALAAQPWDFMPVAAELLIRSGHPDEAKECIARMRQKEVAVPAAAYLEGMMADRQGQLREAVTSWKKAVSLGYRQPAVHMMLASALSRLGDVQSAIDQLRTLTTDAPNYVEGHLALAQLLVQMRDWPQVQDQAREVLQRVPGHAGALLLELQARTYLLAAANGSPQEWQAVESRLADLEKQGQETLAVKMLQAQIAMIRKDFPKAETLLQDLQGKYPAEMKIPLLQADLSVAQGQKEQARARFQEAVTKFPQAFEPVRGLALFLNQQNERQACETVMKEAMTRLSEPRLRRDVGLTLAEFYRQWKEEDKLIQWLGELAVQFPADIQPRRQLLSCEEVATDARRAQGLVEEIKKLEGDAGYQWRYEQARLWGRSEGEEFKTRYPEAVKLLQENLQANPKDYASRLLLAATYEKANELSLAVTTYRETLGLLPDNALSDYTQVLVRTVAALNRAKQYDEAGQLLAQAEQRNLRDSTLDRLRTEADLRQRKFASAEERLTQLVDRDPNDVSSRLSLAYVWIQEEKYAQAQKILDELRAKTPDSVSVAAAQIGLYVQQNQGPEAIRFCDELVTRLHNGPAYTLRARAYIALKQNDKALEDYGRIIALDPKNAESWAVRADFNRMIGRVPEGISDIRKALELAPENPTIQRIAVLLFVASNDLSLIGEAEGLLSKALAGFEKAPPTNTEEARLTEYNQLRLLKAQILLARSTGPGLEEARRLLRDITASQPKMPEAWQTLAQLELSQEDPRKASDVALQGLTHNPDYVGLLLLKARAEKVRQPAVAVLTLKGLLDQNPRNLEIVVELADAYARAERTQQAVELLQEKRAAFEGLQRRRCDIAYAEALYANGQRDEAKTLFETLMKAEPNDPTPTLSLAQRLRKERRWTEMNQLVRRWLAAHPKDADVATTIARVLAAAGDKQALLMGEDILRVTLEQNPRSLAPLMLLAMMMQDAGRNEEAARLDRQVLTLDPQNVIALNNLAWILCDGTHDAAQYREALTLAQKGLQVVPDYVDLLDTRGYAYYRLGDYEKALADFQRCVELYPTNSPSAATPQFHMAMTCDAMKRRTDAVEHLRATLDLNRASLRSAREQADAGRVTYAIKVIKDALRLQEEMAPLQTSLGIEKTAGPSEQELAEAKALMEQLQKGT